MLKLTATVVGVGLVTMEILIEEFNDGRCSTLASWLAGAYIGLGAISVSQNDLLCGVLCLIPTLAIVISNLIRKSGQRIEGRPA